MADKKLLEQIKERSRIQQKTVRVPRWDIDVTITELNYRQKEEMAEAAKRDGRKGEDGKVTPLEWAIFLIAHGCVEPCFTVDDLREFVGDEYGTEPLDYLGAQVAALNGMGERGMAQAENSFPDTEAGK